jgi:hypothetical protein
MKSKKYLQILSLATEFKLYCALKNSGKKSKFFEISEFIKTIFHLTKLGVIKVLFLE